MGFRRCPNPAKTPNTYSIAIIETASAWPGLTGSLKSRGWGALRFHERVLAHFYAHFEAHLSFSPLGSPGDRSFLLFPREPAAARAVKRSRATDNWSRPAEFSKVKEYILFSLVFASTPIMECQHAPLKCELTASFQSHPEQREWWGSGD